MSVRKITTTALLLSMCYILPVLSGNIPEIGNMLCLMHIPVFLGGIILGWQYGLFLGIVAPLSRSLFFGTPVFYPNAIGMAVELASYGVISSVMYKLFSKTNVNKKIAIIISLLIAMVVGRCIWGLSRWFLTIFNGSAFTAKMFVAGAFVNSWPGVILQLILIPILILALEKTYLFKRKSL